MKLVYENGKMFFKLFKTHRIYVKIACFIFTIVKKPEVDRVCVLIF